MTPRASKLYMALLDAEMPKTASLLTGGNTSTKTSGLFSGGAKKLIAELAERAGKVGLEAPTMALSPGGLKEFQKMLVAAEERLAQKVVAKAKGGGSLPMMLGLAGAGGLGGGALGYSLGSSPRQEELTKNKLLAYGGGIATGLAAPSILRGLNSVVSNQGLLPGSFDGYASEFTDI